jgi:hypothetical protein
VGDTVGSKQTRRTLDRCPLSSRKQTWPTACRFVCYVPGRDSCTAAIHFIHWSVRAGALHACDEAKRLKVLVVLMRGVATLERPGTEPLAPHRVACMKYIGYPVGFPDGSPGNPVPPRNSKADITACPLRLLRLNAASPTTECVCRPPASACHPCLAHPRSRGGSDEPDERGDEPHDAHACSASETRDRAPRAMRPDSDGPVVLGVSGRRPALEFSPGANRHLRANTTT